MPIIKLTAISILVLIISITSISALDFEFSSPEIVELNEEFIISIKVETTNLHDIKVFIRDNDKKILSEIYNSGWKNPYYYVKEAIPEKIEFKIKAIESPGNHEICARIRETGKTNFDENCNQIQITQDEKQQETKEEIEKEQPKQEQNKEPEIIENHKPEVKKISTQSISENTIPEKIVLNSNPPKKTETVFITKKEKTRTGVIYAFSILAIIIIILLALKKL